MYSNSELPNMNGAQPLKQSTLILTTPQQSATDLQLEYDAFIRSIKRNQDITHAFLIGAGASISSGVQSATDCIWDWKKDIFTSKNPNQSDFYSNIKAESVRNSIQNWLNNEGGYPVLNSPEEYSFYAKKAYPITDDRRKYFQSLSERKEPYVGYKLLMLLAEAEIVRSIWSTNFDGLVVKAAHQMNLTPIEIALDSVERIYRNGSRNELLSIALHGDYKYGELKNTSSELDAQHEVFVESLRRYIIDKSLIIIGYSGRDKSLMTALKSAFSQRGSGRLYWCGYGNNISDEVVELIQIARANNREAYFVSTDGFDKTMLHLAKVCFEGNTILAGRVQEILKASGSEDLPKVPFTLDVPRTNYLIKSNLHPISIPKEVFQFEIEYFSEEKPWATIRELCKDHEIVAVPFKKKVFAISTKSAINDAFKGRLKSEIVRVPISKYDVQNVSAFKELVLASILRGISSIRGLMTDKKSRLWLSSIDASTEINGIKISVHKAIELSITFDNSYAFLSIKPDIYLDAQEQIPKEIRQVLGKRYFEKLFNNKYDEFLNFWRSTIFVNGKLNFEFPVNSGSGLSFTISNNNAFAEIMLPNKSYSFNIPDNYDRRQTLYKGIQFLEPDLIFRNKNSNSEISDFHPMRGLIANRPFDYLLNGKVFSSDINVGIICPKQYADKFYQFLNGINQTHNAGVNPDYLIDYPGFGSSYKIPINIPLPDSERWADLSISHTASDIKGVALQLARLITTKIDQLTLNERQLIVTIFIPNEWQAYRKFDDEGETFNLHDYIKAYAAQKGVSTQLIEENTLSDNLKCQIYWWLSLSYYVKSLRTPWVLANLDKSTAFAGIGYSVDQSRYDRKIVLGCSHIYNSQGEGLKYKLSKVDEFTLDRQSNPFMSYNDAFQFGVSIRELFLNSMDALPKRVVVHKRTRFTKDEINGICDSLKMAGISDIDLIEITFEQDVRYLATKVVQNELQIDGFPMSRGVCLVTSKDSALLWTHGIVPSVRNPSYKYYLGGRSIPTPLKITKHYGEGNINAIATEILGLSKMNWNSFDLYTKLPATIHSSNEIARIGNLLSRFEGKTYDYRFFI